MLLKRNVPFRSKKQNESDILVFCSWSWWIFILSSLDHALVSVGAALTTTLAVMETTSGKTLWAVCVSTPLPPSGSAGLRSGDGGAHWIQHFEVIPAWCAVLSCQESSPLQDISPGPGFKVIRIQILNSVADCTHHCIHQTDPAALHLFPPPPSIPSGEAVWF